MTHTNAMAAPAGDTIFMIEAVPRKTPKFPELPQPLECRPDGSLPPLVMNFISGDVPRGVDIALGRVQMRDANDFVRAIMAAEGRSIHLTIDDCGGDGDGALAIAVALLQHKWAVTCRIIGKCSSGAAIIALAADRHRRTISRDGGYVLLHNSRRLCTPAQWEEISRLPLLATDAINDSMNDLDDAFSAMLQARMGISDEQARRSMREDRKWNAAEALERGFVRAIDDQGTPVERLRDGYGIMDAGETLHGANYAVEFTAQSILKCAAAVSSGSSGPGATAVWAVSRSRALVPGYAGAYDSIVSGRVDILYDQSGNGRDIHAPTIDARPIATTSGPNSRACCFFSPTSIIVGHTLQTAGTVPMSQFISAGTGYMVVSIRPDIVTQDSTLASDNQHILSHNSSGNGGGLTVRSGGILYAYNWDGSEKSAASATSAVPIGGNPCVVEWRHAGGVIYQRVNGANETSIASGNTTDLTGVLRMSYFPFYNGKLFEAMIYATVPALADRNAIVSDMMIWVGA